jgi:hypothetical protein
LALIIAAPDEESKAMLSSGEAWMEYKTATVQ